MPNTVPPIVTCSQALEYRNELLKRVSTTLQLVGLLLCALLHPLTSFLLYEYPLA